MSNIKYKIELDRSSFISRIIKFFKDAYALWKWNKRCSKNINSIFK
jgi:hypothetical protein